jgi:hypothetical protein
MSGTTTSELFALDVPPLPPARGGYPAWHAATPRGRAITVMPRGSVPAVRTLAPRTAPPDAMPGDASAQAPLPLWGAPMPAPPPRELPPIVLRALQAPAPACDDPRTSEPDAIEIVGSTAQPAPPARTQADGEVPWPATFALATLVSSCSVVVLSWLLGVA